LSSLFMLVEAAYEPQIPYSLIDILSADRISSLSS